MIISFKFSLFELEIEHKILKELGSFTIFCMKAFSNNMRIDEISNIIQLEKEVIKKQLTFSISRKYLTDDFDLTEKGIETLKLFEFINIFNERKVKIALEHYIENSSKLLYSANNKSLEDNTTGYVVKDNLFDYKIQNKFDEILEKDIEKIKDFILVDFDNYKTIIEKYLNDFIFKINKNEELKFYNYEIDNNTFIKELNESPSATGSSIFIDIPILEVKKIIESEILEREHINKIKSKFDRYKYFNLINGELSLFEDQKNMPNANFKIEPLMDKKNIIKNNMNDEQMQFNDLLYIDMKTEIKESYQTMFFDITKIMDNI